jgi:hypothetical protein
LPLVSLNSPLPALVVWGLLYISDYAFTVTCARLRQKQQKFASEGSYELNPVFQRDIDTGRIVSTRFLLAMMSVLMLMSLLWVLTADKNPELFQAAMGVAIGLQLAIHVRHIRNLFLFRVVNGEEINGRIEYARALTLKMSAVDFVAFSILFLVLFAFTGSWFILGGAAGNLLVAVKHSALAAKHRSSTVAALQAPRQPT